MVLLNNPQTTKTYHKDDPPAELASRPLGFDPVLYKEQVLSPPALRLMCQLPRLCQDAEEEGEQPNALHGNLQQYHFGQELHPGCTEVRFRGTFAFIQRADVFAAQATSPHLPDHMQGLTRCLWEGR